MGRDHRYHCLSCLLCQKNDEAGRKRYTEAEGEGEGLISNLANDDQILWVSSWACTFSSFLCLKSCWVLFECETAMPGMLDLLFLKSGAKDVENEGDSRIS